MQANDAGSGGSTLHVAGNTLVDHGKVVRLLGVDHAGTEYSCVGGGSDGSKGYAIFDGPSDDSLVLPMLAWKINAVRVPLNEACWLGIGVVNPAYAGKSYQTAIETYVSMIRSHGIYVILDLHWSAPGTSVGTSQQPMADADNAPTFWKAVATAFAGDLGVVFDLFNEPYLATSNINGGTDPWACLENGCSAQLQKPLSGNYQTAGHQSLVRARARHGREERHLGLGSRLHERPVRLGDPQADRPTTGNLAASLHLYNFNGCTDATPAGTCATGRSRRGFPSSRARTARTTAALTSFVDAYMTWADALGISYLGWAWNPYDCSGFPALVSDYDGTATAFGQGLKRHLLSLWTITLTRGESCRRSPCCCVQQPPPAHRFRRVLGSGVTFTGRLLGGLTTMVPVPA